ncbi:MAG: hypothetical protein IKS19_04825 [Clostridia bacterium]|nr:hypothetical protein [Clostridia bacterium]
MKRITYVILALMLSVMCVSCAPDPVPDEFARFFDKGTMLKLSEELLKHECDINCCYVFYDTRSSQVCFNDNEDAGCSVCPQSDSLDRAYEDFVKKCGERGVADFLKDVCFYPFYTEENGEANIEEVFIRFRFQQPVDGGIDECCIYYCPDGSIEFLQMTGFLPYEPLDGDFYGTMDRLGEEYLLHIADPKGYYLNNEDKMEALVEAAGAQGKKSGGFRLSRLAGDSVISDDSDTDNPQPISDQTLKKAFDDYYDSAAVKPWYVECTADGDISDGVRVDFYYQEDFDLETYHPVVLSKWYPGGIAPMFVKDLQNGWYIAYGMT